jgi:hypothetical protein
MSKIGDEMIQKPESKVLKLEAEGERKLPNENVSDKNQKGLGKRSKPSEDSGKDRERKRPRTPGISPAS